MQRNRFDEFSKALASGAPRRTLLKLLLAAPLAGILGRIAEPETAQAQVCTPPRQDLWIPCYYFCHGLFPTDDYRAKLCICKEGACSKCGPAAPSGHPDLCRGACCPPDAPTCCNGVCINFLNKARQMFSGAAEWLGRNVETINAVNVFPTANGDTGSNMLATLTAAVEGAHAAPSAGAVLRGAADAALLGAHGKSGVILSTMLDGFAAGASGAETLDAAVFAAAIGQADRTARLAVPEPQPGTMLSVLTNAAQAAAMAAAESQTFGAVLAATVAAAKASVSRTPDLLPVLDQAGVVDAGGLGLAVILEGLLFSLRGRPLPPARRHWPAGGTSGGNRVQIDTTT